ncbi:hypothetical protein NLJ89_g10913 [Agrocybe chaxingu]|uniref:NodB homology domain-containing protein n=1 Tax=Agrocybe chaxingu TaxID=84603 RepID=A0A9W8JMX0_9AGAR|nr:hypothetical protein NLJ89_g10913 [Agrocybe chaxingu]
MLASSFVVLSLVFSGLASPAELSKRDGAPVVTKCSTSNVVALTFDDGPYIYMKEVVDTLKAAGGKGTFFVNGKNYGCIYDPENVERIKYAYDNGFQIASHTWSHKDLSTLSWDEIASEMEKTEDAIERITGAKTGFTRPPFGSYNDQVLQVAASRSQEIVTWDFDSGDSVGTSPEEQKQLYVNAVSSHPDGILSLQHEVYESSARDVLPYAIQQLQDSGYRLVTLAECLGKDPYLSQGTTKDKDDSWQC